MTDPRAFSTRSQRGLRAGGIILGVLGGVVNIVPLTLWLHALSPQREGDSPSWYYGGLVGLLVTMVSLAGAGLVCSLVMINAPRRGSMFLIVFALASVAVSIVPVFLWYFYALILSVSGILQALGGVLGLMSLNPPQDPESLGATSVMRAKRQEE